MLTPVGHQGGRGSVKYGTVLWDGLIDRHRTMDEKLYFNGIQGTTGTYAVSPLTAEALAERILVGKSRATQDLRTLQRELAHRTSNAEKIVRITRLLTRDIAQAIAARVPLNDAWFTHAAHQILTIVFGGSLAPQPGDVRLLAERLSQDAVGTITRIVELLGAGEGTRLGRWLLNYEDVDLPTLRSILELRADQALASVRQEYLDVDGRPVLDEGGEIATAWIDDFTWALHQVPIDSLKGMPGKDAIRGPLRVLVQVLKSLVDVDSPVADQATRDAQQHIAELGRLTGRGASVSWHHIVSLLHSALTALRYVESPVGGFELRGALTVWLDELRRGVLGHLGAVPWVDPADLRETGWGLIFPATLPEGQLQAILRALSPLLALRREQSGDLFRIYARGEGYRPGDTAQSFLSRPPRHAVASNPVDPRATGVPYYLLLIGDPVAIPFEFQYQLDVQYGVGRLDFGTDYHAYANYAYNVVASEKMGDRSKAPVIFWGADNPGDEATHLTAHHLVRPLTEHFRRRSQSATSDWEILHVAPEHATRVNLLQLLKLKTAPALLFAAGHGLEFPAEDPRQPLCQGALLCQDWNGERGEVPPEYFVSAADITSEINLQGSILFLFACFSAGTPQYDAFSQVWYRGQARNLAHEPFVSALPKAVLGLKDRGALAVIGHVDRAWGLSFLSDLTYRPEGLESRRREHVEVFASTLDRLLNGWPVGTSMDFFNMRYAAIATELAYLYDHLADPPARDEVYRLAELWTAHNDARNVIVLGDPAVRLRALS